MAPVSGQLWAYFHSSTNKPNGVHYRVTHWRCIDARPAAEPIDVDSMLSLTPRACRRPSWSPVTLAKLLGGAVARPIGKPARRPRVVLEEALYMELLAAEHSDEESDAGALEGSGDDFEV
ncbi:hypothetical protein DFH09DRAFT_1497658 [Mycena vulgaris]|nr:hypothetical protein DFH09DRAFT_1497658 [Mycena vulgaris]